ncbi:nucleotidyltransferase family protein [Tsuneonella mangrovi]|uniref:nucleotidyltransferase domain-containing protein n=1 Tax=Tsuneonella mangrovi TaxID=1982042 RepID=UPI001471031D|nr:nucleotidyltransferase family protein [Tsuneonella mangrovi]
MSEPGEILLRICARPGADHGARLATLDPVGWEQLAALASEQRVTALLAQALANVEDELAVPPAVARQMDEQVERERLYTLNQSLALVRMLALLADAGLEPICLKGVRLAHLDYPRPELRPMRDLDLLLEPADAERAQELLLASGRYKIADGRPAYGIEASHQLPPLVDTERKVMIELHHRLDAKDFARERDLLALMRAQPENTTVFDRTVCVPTAHACLLHIVAHAALQHLFDNGPVVLADVHYLAANDELDWHLLMQDAQALGLDKALGLIAALARELGAEWLDRIPDSLPEPSAECLSVVRAAMLSPSAGRDRQRFLRRMQHDRGASATARTTLDAMLHPDPDWLAAIVGVGPGNPARWLGYPVWLAQRARRYRDSRSDPTAIDLAAARSRLRDWLLAQGSES